MTNYSPMIKKTLSEICHYNCFFLDANSTKCKAFEDLAIQVKNLLTQ